MGVKSFTELKKGKYRVLREKHSHLPSYHIHIAYQDSSTRIKSFTELERKILAKLDKPFQVLFTFHGF